MTPEILRSLSEVDRYLGQWSVMGHLAAERLAGLRRIATIAAANSFPIISPPGYARQGNRAPHIHSRISCDSRHPGEFAIPIQSAAP